MFKSQKLGMEDRGGTWHTCNRLKDRKAKSPPTIYYHLLPALKYSEFNNINLKSWVWHGTQRKVYQTKDDIQRVGRSNGRWLLKSRRCGITADTKWFFWALNEVVGRGHSTVSGTQQGVEDIEQGTDSNFLPYTSPNTQREMLNSSHVLSLTALSTLDLQLWADFHSL